MTADAVEGFKINTSGNSFLNKTSDGATSSGINKKSIIRSSDRKNTTFY